MGSVPLSRRQFLVTTSVFLGGMALGIRTAHSDLASAGGTLPSATAGHELSAWIEIRPDNSVVIRAPTPEIGNGAMTQVAMNVCEELACDWEQVRIEFCSMNRNHREGDVYKTGFLPFFGGHGTERVRMTHAMQLGASARERLKAAAAARWQVSADEIAADNSVLIHTPTGRRLSYGEVAEAAAAIQLTEEPALKKESEWRLIGKVSPRRKHIPDVVTGKTVYGIDVKVPGMVHAALKQCPVHGGKLKQVDRQAVLSMPGVLAVVVIDPAKTVGSPVPAQATWGFDNNQVQSGVAVIAEHYWQAKLALDALPLEWDLGAGARWTTTEAIYTEGHAGLDDDSGAVLREAGDVTAVVAGKTVEARYATPYCENAMVEPLNATALMTADSLEVWCPTQDMLQAFWVAVDESGLLPERVQFHQTFVGGRFGRGTQGDDVRMAVAIAREYPGVPVKTIWSREECFRQGRFRTPIATRLQATLDEAGYPVAVVGKANYIGTQPLFQLSLGFDDAPYFTSGIIPNVRLSRSNYPLTIMNGAYRAPCYNANAFFIETFIDECAVAAGIDPLEYRLQLVSRWDPPWGDCLRLAAERNGWGEPAQRGQGRGIAISSWPAAATRNAGSVVCAAAQVTVTRQGELTVERIDVAFDCGRVANADAVRQQIESAVLFAMNMTLQEQLTFRDGAVVEENFHQYPLLRMGDRLPAIHVHFEALSGHERFDIIGEAPVGPVGPAIGNAIFQATGKRLRTTPFLQHDLSWS